MSKTTNYGLYIESGNTAKFADWREKINGEVDSNMIKIDVALSQKANNSRTVTTTLLASAWVGTDAPFTQELTVPGLSALQNGTISIAHNATVEQRKIASEAMISVIGQENEKLIIVADGEIPAFDIPVCIILLD